MITKNLKILIMLIIMICTKNKKLKLIIKIYKKVKKQFRYIRKITLKTKIVIIN